MIKQIQKWKMKNQLLLFFLSVFTIATVVIGMILYFAQSLMMQILKESTTFLEQQQYSQQVSQQFQSQLNLYTETLHLNYNRLNIIREMYYFIQTTDISIIQAQQCPITMNQAYIKSNICFNLLDLQYNETLTDVQYNQIQIYLQQISLLQEVLPMLDTEQFVFGNWSVASAQYEFFSAYQPIGFYDNFIVSQRPFYLKHIQDQAKSDFILSDVFFNFENEYKVTISHNLTDTINEGIVATQFEFKIIKKFFQSDFTILNFDGLILIGDQGQDTNVDQTKLYIFNETITGLNQEDWTEIQNFINRQPYTSNCNSNVNFLCRINSIKQQDILIFAEQMSNPNIILILFKPIALKKALQDQLNLIDSFTRTAIAATLLFMIFSAICTLFIAIIFVNHICQNLNNLSKLANSNFKRSIKDLNILTFLNEIQQNTKEQNAIWQLSKTYIRILKQMASRNFQKNSECKMIEAFAFPQSESKKFRECIIKSRSLYCKNYNTPPSLVNVIKVLPKQKNNN